MGHYEQRVQILKPATVSTGYGSATKLTYDTEEGATLTDVPFGVDMQPRMQSSSPGDGERIEVQIGWTLHTPRGRDLVVAATDRIRYAGEDLSVVGRPGRWPSSKYPSGVDHVELALERKEG